MTKDQTGVFWLGTVDNGLLAIEPSGTTRRYQNDGDPKGLPHNHIIALHADRKGRIWVGTDGGGLAQLDSGTNTFFQYRSNANNPASIADDEVRTIYEDRAGHIWVGTAQGGLNMLDDTTGAFRHFQHDAQNRNSLSDGQVLSIVEDAKGTLWIGTEKGLSEWRPLEQEFVTYTNDQADLTAWLTTRLTPCFRMLPEYCG